MGKQTQLLIISRIMHLSFCNASFFDGDIDIPAPSKARESDVQLAALPASPGRLMFDELFVQTCERKSVCDVPTVNTRALMSSDCHPHNISHPGTRTMQRLVHHRLVRLGVNTDVRNCVRKRVPFQRSKIHRHTGAPSSPYGIIILEFTVFLLI